MNPVTITAAAEADLGGIWEWIAADHRRAADKMVRDIETACRRAARQPLSGSRRSDFTARPVRFMLVRRIIYIVYDPATAPLQILRVLHTSRDIKTVLAEDS